jgi:hypothetical protein
MFLQTASLRSDNCSPSPGQLFAIVRNGCSASFGITVRHHRNTQCATIILVAFGQASCFLPQIRAKMFLFVVPGGRGAMEKLSLFASHRPPWYYNMKKTSSDYDKKTNNC